MMSHHSGSPDNDMYELLRLQLNAEIKAGNERLGATGVYPNGKLTKGDEGQVKMAVASVGGKIVLDFGKPVAWVGFTAAEARGLAELLIKHADQAGH
jgi:hypothetical protein